MNQVQLLLLALFVAGGIVHGQTVAGNVSPKESLPERVAREFAEASPLADPSDARARDAASAKLADCRIFKSAVKERILWGGCEPVKGFDPKIYSLTEFEPLVWLKLYASTIMFTGEHELRKEGAYTILEMKAKFRSKLDAGDYPYPFWHSAKKWQAYVDLASLALVFDGDRIIAAYRIAQPDPSRSPADRPWDGKWRWTDARGEEQPRAALFSYLFGGDNPHRKDVDQAYRQLEAKFRAQSCTTCHAPDNRGRAKELLLLNYPNQSLASRHSLVKVLTDNQMPPEDTANNHPAGISEGSARVELIQLAKAFAREADAAIAFESARTTGTKPASK